MYNFNEIQNLSELKELCFYIKAINEAQVDAKKLENMGQVKDYLKNEYNLEISVSKLYLFVQKIISVYNNKGKFPEVEVVDDIIKQYISKVRKDLKAAEKSVELANLNFKDPKHKVGKNKFLSSQDLSHDISLKKKIYAKESNVLLIWAAVISVFFVSLTYCIIGISFPKLLSIYMNKAQEIVLLLLSICILTYLIYWLLYFVNRKNLNELKFYINNYYRYETVIRYDIGFLNKQKQGLFGLRNMLSINGMELTDELMYNFIKNSDDLDIKYFNSKVNSKKIGGGLVLKTKNKPETFGQVISRYEQNNNWKESELAKLEKKYINQELVARINALAGFMNSKGIADIELARSMSDLYCKELSVNERKVKIDDADSKIQLSKNYVVLVDKILEFEKFNIFNSSKNYSVSKADLVVTAEERVSFSNSLTAMFNRIEKAEALGLLSSGQAETYKNIKKELHSGIVQGVEVESVAFRYDLAKLYIRLYEELVTYDVLN